VRLNEILPVPGLVDWDGNGKVNTEDQWIELYNAGSTTVDLGGWSIARMSYRDLARSHNGRQVKEDSYYLPADTLLQPGEFLVVYGLKSELVLDTKGGQVRLLDSQGQEVDRVIYGALAPDVSYSRAEDGTWYVAEQPTPGETNVTSFTPAARATERPARRGR